MAKSCLRLHSESVECLKALDDAHIAELGLEEVKYALAVDFSECKLNKAFSSDESVSL